MISVSRPLLTFIASRAQGADSSIQNCPDLRVRYLIYRSRRYDPFLYY